MSSPEGHRVPTTADQLLQRIIDAKRVPKTPQQVSRQFGRIAGKLMSRAEVTGVGLYRQDANEPGLIVIEPPPGNKQFGKNLHMVRPAESGLEVRDIFVKPGGKTEVRWTEAPQESYFPTTYAGPSRAVKAETNKKLFRKPETRFTADVLHEDSIDRDVPATPGDLSQAARVLGEIRGGLAEKESMAQTLEAIQSLPESKGPND